MLIRPNTYDKEIVKEVKHCYKGLELKGKKVLDIGANIGAFSRLAYKQGAEVITFEPDKENFSLLQKNSPNTLNINKAVVGNGDKTRNFYLNRGINKGSHSLEIKRGRKEIMVDCCNFKEILEKYKPDVLKVDIEGGEYEIFDSVHKIPYPITQIAIELHLTKKKWRNKEAKKLIQKLINEGFNPVKHPQIGQKNWHTVGVFKR